MFKSAMPTLLCGRLPALMAAGLMAGAVAFAATPAHATLEIKLQSGALSYTQSGGSPLTVDHSIGNFTTSVSTGTATAFPSLDLSSADISTSAGGTLVISLSENDLTSPTGLNAWLAQFTGDFSDGAATVTLKTYLDNTNTLLGTGTLLSSFTDSSTPFSRAISKEETTSSPFAITDVLTIVSPGSSHLSLDALVSTDGRIGNGGNPVPEPASFALLGTALLGFTAFAHRRRRA